MFRSGPLLDKESSCWSQNTFGQWNAPEVSMMFTCHFFLQPQLDWKIWEWLQEVQGESLERLLRE